MRSLIFNKYLWSLTLGHLTIDLYSGAMPVVILFLTIQLHLSLEQVGLVSFLYSIFSSVSQPIFGYLSDRYGGRAFASGGILWMSVFQGLLGFVPDFTTLLILAPLAGLGSAAFHPQGASSANRASGDRKSLGMAIFLLGGNGGFAFGPLLAALLVGGLAIGNISLPGFGLHGTAVMSLLGLALAPMLFILAGRSQPVKQPTPAVSSAGRSMEYNRAFTRFAILALVLVMSLRAWSQSSIALFVPQFFTTLADFSPFAVSQLSFLISFALAIGSLLGGFIADRAGGRTVMAVSFLITAPATWLLFNTRDANVFLVAPMLGFVIGAAWPPTLVMAQELFPKNAGVASGIALGFVFGMGGLGNYITGILAEPSRLGLFDAMMVVAALPLLAALCTLPLPSHADVARGAKAARTSEPSSASVTNAAGR